MCVIYDIDLEDGTPMVVVCSDAWVNYCDTIVHQHVPSMCVWIVPNTMED